MDLKHRSSETAVTSPERPKAVSGPPVLLFNASKKESHHPNNGFKKLYRRLKGSYKVQLNKDDITLERLKEAALVVFGCPREKFSSAEFAAIKDYVEQGGSVLLALGEGGEGRCGTNVNYLLEEFGIAVNSDSVVRTVFYKYLHPKTAQKSKKHIHVTYSYSRTKKLLLILLGFSSTRKSNIYLTLQ